jgi:hypothetical protein
VTDSRLWFFAAFYRVDVRLEKRRRFGEGRSVAFVLEGQNVTLSKEGNTLGMDCRGGDDSGRLHDRLRPPKFGPITLPSLGVEAFFLRSTRSA